MAAASAASPCIKLLAFRHEAVEPARRGSTGQGAGRGARKDPDFGQRRAGIQRFGNRSGQHHYLAPIDIARGPYIRLLNRMTVRERIYIPHTVTKSVAMDGLAISCTHPLTPSTPWLIPSQPRPAQNFPGYRTGCAVRGRWLSLASAGEPVHRGASLALWPRPFCIPQIARISFPLPADRSGGSQGVGRDGGGLQSMDSRPSPTPGPAAELRRYRSFAGPPAAAGFRP